MTFKNFSFDIHEVIFSFGTFQYFCSTAPLHPPIGLRPYLCLDITSMKYYYDFKKQSTK